MLLLGSVNMANWWLQNLSIADTWHQQSRVYIHHWSLQRYYLQIDPLVYFVHTHCPLVVMMMINSHAQAWLTQITDTSLLGLVLSYTIHTKGCGHPSKLVDLAISATPVADRCIKSSTQPCNLCSQTLAVEWPSWRAVTFNVALS